MVTHRSSHIEDGLEAHWPSIHLVHKHAHLVSSFLFQSGFEAVGIIHRLTIQIVPLINHSLREEITSHL